MKCQGKTLEGKKCKNVVSETKYCHHHKRSASKYSFCGKKHYSMGTTKKVCRKKLSDKIKINMKEYKSGRWTSPKQAVAVSFSQVKKKNPRCKKYLSR